MMISNCTARCRELQRVHVCLLIALHVPLLFRKSTMSLLNDGAGELTICAAQGCCITGFDASLCKPACDKKCVAMTCGQTSKSEVCCDSTSMSQCLCPSHVMFDDVLVGNTPKDEVLCVLCHREQLLVKPYCLSGEKPCCKGYSEGCCMQSRNAIPADDDVPRMCASYAIKCCDCDPFKIDFQPCAKLKPLSKEARSRSVEVEEAVMTDEYLLCAGCCWIWSMYIPESYTGAFGATDSSLCACCIENGCTACMLPKNAEEEVLLLTSAGQARCIKPPIRKGGPCCKGTTRVFCSVMKFAFPCDQEVPCVLAACGYKCAERTIDGRFKWGDVSVHAVGICASSPDTRRCCLAAAAAAAAAAPCLTPPLLLAAAPCFRTSRSTRRPERSRYFRRW